MTSLLAGSHTLKIWYGRHGQLRLAAPVQMGESDFILNGNTAWLWQSSTNSVTKFTLPADRGAGQKAVRPQTPLTGHKAVRPETPLTPQKAAQEALAEVGPSTRVTTETNVTVAGQPAYQLVLAPRSAQSLIGKITIALDAQHLSVPLRVQVFARGATSPALQIGYTSISFVAPAAANFQFTPPPGAKVHTAFFPGTGWYAYAPLSGQRMQATPTQSRVIGKNWLSVAVLPASALSELAGQGNAASVAGQAARSASGGGGSVSGSAVFGALLGSAHPVHGAWGSGRLLHTSLLSVLITSTGHMLVGAVNPSVLYAAAAQVK
jgi:outer membrane lipoprotein-sorting protein